MVFFHFGLVVFPILVGCITIWCWLKAPLCLSGFNPFLLNVCSFLLVSATFVLVFYIFLYHVISNFGWLVGSCFIHSFGATIIVSIILVVFLSSRSRSRAPRCEEAEQAEQAARGWVACPVMADGKDTAKGYQRVSHGISHAIWFSVGERLCIGNGLDRSSFGISFVINRDALY